MPKPTLTQRIEVARLERRRQAASRYREILLQDGDENAAAEAMALLARSPQDLDADLELVSRIERCKELSGQVEKLNQDLQRQRVVLTNAQREYEEGRMKFEAEWTAKLEKLQQGYNQVEGRANDAVRARGELPTLEDTWSALVAGISFETLREERRARMLAVVPQPVHGSAGVPSSPTREQERELLAANAAAADDQAAL